ncbi:hypothetical protein N2152v2_000289 [Parachlorella kessleri]
MSNRQIAIVAGVVGASLLIAAAGRSKDRNNNDTVLVRDSHGNLHRRRRGHNRQKRSRVRAQGGGLVEEVVTEEPRFPRHHRRAPPSVAAQAAAAEAAGVGLDGGLCGLSGVPLPGQPYLDGGQSPYATADPLAGTAAGAAAASPRPNTYVEEYAGWGGRAAAWGSRAQGWGLAGKQLDWSALLKVGAGLLLLRLVPALASGDWARLVAYLVLAGLAAQLVMGLMSQVSHGGCLEGDTVAERALAGLATQPGVRFMAQTDGVSPPRAGYQRVGPPRTPGVAAALAAEVSNLPDPSTPLSAAAASARGRQPFYKPPFTASVAADDVSMPASPFSRHRGGVSTLDPFASGKPLDPFASGKPLDPFAPATPLAATEGGLGLGPDLGGVPLTSSYASPAGLGSISPTPASRFSPAAAAALVADPAFATSLSPLAASVAAEAAPEEDDSYGPPAMAAARGTYMEPLGDPLGDSLADPLAGGIRYAPRAAVVAEPAAAFSLQPETAAPLQPQQQQPFRPGRSFFEQEPKQSWDQPSLTSPGLYRDSRAGLRRSPSPCPSVDYGADPCDSPLLTTTPAPAAYAAAAPAVDQGYQPASGGGLGLYTRPVPLGRVEFDEEEVVPTPDEVLGDVEPAGMDLPRRPPVVTAAGTAGQPPLSSLGSLFSSLEERPAAAAGGVDYGAGLEYGAELGGYGSAGAAAAAGGFEAPCPPLPLGAQAGGASHCGQFSQPPPPLSELSSVPSLGLSLGLAGAWDQEPPLVAYMQPEDPAAVDAAMAAALRDCSRGGPHGKHQQKLAGGLEELGGLLSLPRGPSLRLRSVGEGGSSSPRDKARLHRPSTPDLLAPSTPRLSTPKRSRGLRRCASSSSMSTYSDAGVDAALVESLSPPDSPKGPPLRRPVPSGGFASLSLAMAEPSSTPRSDSSPATPRTGSDIDGVKITKGSGGSCYGSAHSSGGSCRSSLSSNPSFASISSTSDIGDSTPLKGVLPRGVAKARSQPEGEADVQQQPDWSCLHELAGVWHKDKAVSDGMEPMCDAMQLGRLMRKAIGLVKGVEIKAGPGTFEMAVLSKLPWFKLRESYPLSGEPVTMRRRDMRRGTSTAHAEPAPSGGVLVKATWGNPCPGSVEEHWRLQSAQTLLCDTLLDVEGKEPVNTRAVFRRRR